MDRPYGEHTTVSGVRQAGGIRLHVVWRGVMTGGVFPRGWEGGRMTGLDGVVEEGP